MKKIILITALMFGGLVAANAQDVSLKSSKQVKQEAQAKKQEEQNARQLEIQNDAAAKRSAIVEEKAKISQKRTRKYNEVGVSEVPQAVKDVVTKKHNGASISRAAVDSRGIYRLKISDASKDSGTRTVYINKSGVSNAPASLKN